LKRLSAFVFGIVVCITAVHAQISIDTITTDTVDIFNQTSLDAPKSAIPALWLSAIVPGSGHQMLNRPKSALTYLSIDVIALCGAFAFHHYSIKEDQNAKALAYLHAEVTNASPDDEFFWQVIGNFNTYQDYHTAYPVDARVFSDRFTGEEYSWNWGEHETFRDDYQTLRKEAKRMSTLSAFFIGAMVLNRLVAVIDLRSSIKNRRYTTTTHDISFIPVHTTTSNGLMVSATF